MQATVLLLFLLISHTESLMLFYYFCITIKHLVLEGATTVQPVAKRLETLQLIWPKVVFIRLCMIHAPLSRRQSCEDSKMEFNT